MQTERWALLNEFPHYSVSTHGRVKTVVPFPMPHGGFKRMREIVPVPSRGYVRVLLSCKPHNSVRKCVPIHRLVLTAFRGNPLPGQQANHLNGIKTDNRLDNLEWVTGSQNLKHAIQHRLYVPRSGEQHWMKRHPDRIAKGSQLPQTKLSADQVRQIRSERLQGRTLMSLSQEFGVCFQLISMICRR